METAPTRVAVDCTASCGAKPIAKEEVASIMVRSTREGAEAKGAAPQRGKADGAIYRGDAEVRGGRRGTEAAQEAPQGSFSSRVQSRAQNDGCGGQGGAKPAARSGCRPRPGVPQAHGPLGAAIRPRLGAVFEACVRCPDPREISRATR